MQSIAFLMRESNMTYNEVLELPYYTFFALLKQFVMFNLMQNEEYAKELKRYEKLKNTEPELNKLRKLQSYKAR
ncbi:hypothetical protein [Caldicoprobacter faecalis]|uniref:hypothetical protein n=1 Tax=Caldicoprobacter faecalis TaxID=937334 RepID=UPI000B8657DC|nr:hypothetical protein [Caldicoprobacter faecalis]